MISKLPIFLLIILLACSKDEGSKDKEPPVISLISPTSNQQFNAGETVNITGTVTDNATISELHVHISNLGTGALLYDIHRYPALGNYTLQESFQTESGVSYKIQVIAKDNSANESRSTVEISTN